jgi:hypothetical protein
MKVLASAALLALAVLFPSSDARAAESYDACTGTITALPYTINAPGTWCLKQNLSTAAASGAAITVNASNVTLDCNDFKIDGTAAGMGTANKGVLSSGKLNVTVRNCQVRGFQYGIALLGATGGDHLVEHNRLSANTSYGIFVEGDGSLIRDNQVSMTGGSTLTPHAYGIYARYITDIQDNVVSGVVGNGTAGNIIGIFTLANTGGTVSGNRVHGLVKAGNIGLRGILNTQSSRVVLMRNNVGGDGSTSGIGISCTSSNSRVKDTVVSGFPTGLSGCGDAGRNDITP